MSVISRERAEAVAPAIVTLSAFLLFALQPMAAKELLPAFGGAASVWTVCLLFFQGVLLAGYVWAHVARRRPQLHVVVLALPVLGAVLFSNFETGPGTNPLLAVLVRLGASVGLPYFALSATSPLIQAWMADYRLYAWSNLGSLLGLLGYVFVLDLFDFGPLVLRVGYVVFALLMGMAALGAPASPMPEADQGNSVAGRPQFVSFLLWTLLAACGTGLLASTTNQICQEVAPIPLLWVLPLSLYLATLVICFESPRWYSRVWFGRAAAVLIPVACIITPMGTEAPFWLHLAVDLGALFVTLMLCHGELAELRPEVEHLTWFYLAVGGGGVLGTLMVAVAAPLLFTSYLEFPIFLMAGAVTVLLLWWKHQLVGRSSLAPLAFASLVPLAFFGDQPGTIVAEVRNFYGVARITLGLDTRGSKLVLTHGRTMHGTEYVAEKASPHPSTYYSEMSGVGLALNEVVREGREVGVIGLGAGTLAAYARPGDHWRYYEINPDVIRLAQEPFTYLRMARAPVEVVEGDARLSLARELKQSPAPPRFDVLVVDAFSSDSIPVHLLTGECGAIYKARLAPEGVLAVHISNRTLDLEPVVRGMAAANGLSLVRISNPDDAGAGISASTWLLLAPSTETLKPYASRSKPLETREPIRWRDGHANILPILEFGSIQSMFRK